MKIRVKLIAALLVVLIVPVIVLNIIAGTSFKNSTLEMFVGSIERSVNNQAEDLNFICESMSGQIKEIALSKDIHTYVEKAVSPGFSFDPFDDDYIRASKELSCIEAYGESVIKAMIVEKSGIVLASTSGETDVGKRLPNYSELFDLALVNNGYSSFFMSSENDNKAPVYIVTKSIYSEKNERIGIVYAICNTEYLQKFINDMKLDKYTTVALMDADGNMLEYPFKSAKRYTESLTYSMFSEELSRVCLGGMSSANLGVIRTFKGDKAIKYFLVSPISNSGWYLISSSDKQGLVTSISQTTKTLHWVSFAIVFVLGALSITFAFRFVNPVSEIINIFTEKQKGNQNARFNIRSNDEFRQIAHAFNSMFDNIYESEQRYRTIVEMTNNITFEVNYKKGTVFVSKNFNKKFSFRAKDDTIQESFIYKLRVHKDDQQRYSTDIERVLGPANFLQGEYRVKSIYGDFIWIMIKATKFFDRDDVPTKLIGVIVDIDREKKSEMNLIQKASYDNLTQLYNRETFIKSLVAQLEVSYMKKTLDAVMFIDLDDFKYFNDEFGHACGDEVLKFVADTIKEISFERGFGGRFGGDEFVLCVTNLTLYGDAGKLAQEIIDVLGKGFISESTGQKLSIKCSVGIAFLRESGKTSEEVIAAADEAMYNIKKHGKSAYAYAKSASGSAPATVTSHINEIESDNEPVQHSSSRYDNSAANNGDFDDPIM